MNPNYSQNPNMMQNGYPQLQQSYVPGGQPGMYPQGGPGVDPRIGQGLFQTGMLNNNIPRPQPVPMQPPMNQGYMGNPAMMGVQQMVYAQGFPPQRTNYRQMNWAGYSLPTYQIQPQFIEQYAPGIFAYFDRDRSGSLDMYEVPVMMNHLFAYLKMPPPSINDCLYLMNIFDQNGDGKMDLGEFKNMLYFLGGRR